MDINALILAEKMREPVDKHYVQVLQRLSDKDFLTLEDFCSTRRTNAFGNGLVHRYIIGQIIENKDGFHFEINDAEEDDEVNSRITFPKLASAEAGLFMVLSTELNSK